MADIEHPSPNTFTNADPAIRLSTCRALRPYADIGSETTNLLTHMMLSDARPENRLCAMQALAHASPPNPLSPEAFVPVLRDASLDVQNQAVIVISAQRQIPADAAGDLIRIMKNAQAESLANQRVPVDGIYEAAHKTLQKLGTPVALQAIDDSDALNQRYLQSVSSTTASPTPPATPEALKRAKRDAMGRSALSFLGLFVVIFVARFFGRRRRR